jgi:chemotaxis protein methyltransferase CheR
MYFTEENQQAVLKSLANCLAEDGWLIVSGTEASCVSTPPFKQYSINGSIVFRKTDETEPVTFMPFTDNTSGFTETAIADLVPDPDSLIGVGTYSIEGIPTNQEDQPLPGEADTFPSPKKQDPGDFGIIETDPVEDGVTLYQFGQYPEAIEKLTFALGTANGIDSRRSTAMCTLARAYANQGKLEDALEWAEKTVISDKVNPDFHYLHATILQELGRLDEAAAALKRAVFLNPDFVVAHVSLGNLSRLRGRMKDSERHYRVALAALDQAPADEFVPGSEGLTVEEMRGIIRSTSCEETAHDSA